MNFAATFARFALPMAVIFVLAGCQLRPTIVSANAYSDGANQLIELRLYAQDAYKIKSKQIYFSMDVLECQGAKRAFHVEPYVAGARASDFKFSTEGKYVTFTGTMPSSIFKKYVSPCVLVEGGSYFHEKLESTPVRIVNIDSPS